MPYVTVLITLLSGYACQHNPICSWPNWIQYKVFFSSLSWTRWCPQIMGLSLFVRVLLTSVKHTSICPIQSQRIGSIRLTCDVAQLRFSIISKHTGRLHSSLLLKSPSDYPRLQINVLKVKSSDGVLSRLEFFVYYILYSYNERYYWSRFYFPWLTYFMKIFTKISWQWTDLLERVKNNRIITLPGRFF
jgi:hypothetical protein